MKGPLTKSLVVVSGMLVILLGTITLIGIRIPLTLVKTQIERAAGDLINRQVTIDGGLYLTLSLKPSIDMEEMTIANPDGWPEGVSFVSAGSGTGQLDALSLLGGNIRVLQFKVSDVDLNLVTRADHSANYSFEFTDKADEAQDSGQEKSFLRLAGIDELLLDNIDIVYHDELSGNSYEFTIDEAFGAAPEGGTLSLILTGQLVGQPLHLEISGDELAKLVQLKHFWSLRSGTLTYATATVALTGNVGKEPDSMAGHVDLTLAGSGLTELGRPFGLTLPDSGEFTLGARLSVSPAAIQASSITFTSSPVEVTSDLMLWLHGERPTVMGNVSIDHFDLGLINMVQGESKPEAAVQSEDPAAQFLNFLNREISLGFLRSIDADVHLRGSELQVGAMTLNEVKAVVSLVDGNLIAPLHADLNGAVIETELEIVSGSEESFLSLAGEIEDADLMSLLADADSSERMTVNIGRLAYDIESSGKTLTDFVQNIRTDIQVQNATAVSAGAETLFTSEALSVTRSEDNTWKILGDGELLGRPFSTKTLSGRLRDGQDGPIRGIQVNLEACDTELMLELLAADMGEPVVTSVTAAGHNLCGVLQPAEQFLGGTSNFKVTGQGELGEDRWEIHFDTVDFNTFSGTAAMIMHTSDSGVPFMTVDIHSPILNIDELMNSPKPENSAPAKSAGRSETGPPPLKKNSEADKELTQKIVAILTQEFPALKFLTAADLDFILQLDELIINGGSIADVHLATHLRDGTILNSPFAADMNGTEVSGAVELDLMADEPVFSWDFSSPHAELANIFSSFGLPQAPDLKADNIAVSIVFKGNSILEMMQTSSQEIRIENGLWKIGSEVFSEPILIKVDRGTYVSRTEGPADIAITGSVKDEPLIIKISEDGLLARGTDRPVELSMNASVGDVNLQFAGQLKRNPGGKPTLHLDTQVSGSRLDKLNRLLEYDLPPIGPYKLHGALHTAKNLLTLDELRAEVGDSALNGKVTLRVEAGEDEKLINPSVLEAKFNAPSLQLDDFHIREVAATTSGEEALAAEKPDGETVEEKEPANPESKGDSSYTDLLSAEFSEVIEAHLEVAVDEVLSGKDRLGNGYLMANNRNGKNSLEKLHIEVPGGFIELSGYYQEKNELTEADLHLNMDRFDYGVLVRRAVPQSRIKGLMNIRVDLSAAAADVSSLQKHANGKLRVGVIPEHMEAGIIDLWAVNILASALPVLMKGSESEINCLAADFNFADGMITPEVFLLDTSRMRALGEGFVNLQDESIDFHLKPIPKSPQFFSLATPVNVTGTIRDPHIGVSAGGVIGTVFRIVSGVVTVPLQKIFTEDMAADGAEACSAAMAWVVQ